MIQSNEIHPPSWPLKIIRLFVKKEFIEEIEGDMEELFYDNVEHLSHRKAKRIYTLEALKLLRPVLLRNMGVFERINHYSMFKNYFKISIRGLMKNPLNSFINVFGLSATIGICIFAYAFARWTYSTDQFHQHKNEVYLVTFFANRDGVPQQFGRTPRPLGEMMKEDFAHIKKMCRVEDQSVVMKHGDNVFHERVRFTDPEFLDMFTFPLKWGAPKSLADVNSIILSEDMSIKYFGDENPVGRDIQMIVGKDRSKVFKVTGVAKEFPKALTIRFNFLVNFENLRATTPDYDLHDWTAFVNATFVQVDNPAQLASIEQGMTKYKKFQNDAVTEDWALSSFAFEPLATLHERSEDIRDDISRSSASNYKSVLYLCIVAMFVLVLACFNYINIAIATAAKRLKEIGLRKSIGATRKLVIVQFLSENVVITFFALIIGLILGMTVFVPGFEAMWGFDMDFKLTDSNVWLCLPIILLVTSIASGIYPSIYISKFNVVSILKGSVKFGQKNPLTRIFLCIQIALACVVITIAIMFSQNATYMAEQSWGYDHDQTLYAQVPDRAAYEELRALMSQDPDVLSMSGSGHHLGKSNASTVIHFPDHEYDADVLAIDAHYFETMGMEVKEGREFHDEEGSDRQAVIVNEVLVKNLGLDKAVGQRFTIDSVQYEVVGVVKDFHSYTFDKSIKPTILKVADKDEYRYLSIKARVGSVGDVYKRLQTRWSELFPEIPFSGGFQEDTWVGYFEANRIYGIVWQVVTFIVVSLATLGLYGLVTLNVAGRTREFSIRTALGAGTKSIAINITRQYILLFVLALIIGAPLGYILTKGLYSSFPYHMPVTYMCSLSAVVILLVILFITVLSQVIRVRKMNPVDGLRME